MGKYHSWISLIKKRGGGDDTRLVKWKLHIFNYLENFSKLGHGNYARHVEREQRIIRLAKGE